MVQIIEAGTPKKPTFGQRLNVGVGRGLEVGQQMMQTYQQENAAKKLGLDPEVMRGLDPQTRSQILGEALKRNIDVKRSGATSGILRTPEAASTGAALAGGAGVTPSEERQPQREREPIESVQERQPLPGFKYGQGQSPKRESNGQMPEPVTGGRKKPIWTPQQLLAEGARIAQANRANNNPMTDEEGLREAVAINEMNKTYNREVSGEQAERVLSQRDYGALGEEALKKVYKEATPEQSAAFAKRAEQIAKQYTSEADIKRALAEQATKFSNAVANVRKSAKAPRLIEKLKQKVFDEDKTAEQLKNDYKLKLKPLLEDGFYSTARKLMAEQGFGPEEREEIISELGESTKTALSEFMNIPRSAMPSFGIGGLAPRNLNNNQKQVLSKNLQDIFQQDKNVNLLLLRREYEKKGVGHRDFYDELTKLEKDGKIDLTDDQYENIDLLSSPPINYLKGILKGFNLLER